MLNFYEFVEKLTEEMQGRYPECLVKVQDIQKTNCVRTGLVMIKIDETDETREISPVFYLDDLYELHQNGTCLEEITEKLSDFINSSFEDIPSVKKVISDIKDWNHVKDNLFLKVVNGRDNQKMVKECVHSEFLDLAIIPYVQLKDEMTTTVKKEFTSLWSVSDEEIIHAARQNMLEQKPVTVTNLQELLKQMIIKDLGPKEEIPEELSYIFEEEPSDSESMTVITTPDRHWGAYYICEDVFKNISEQIYNGQDLLIFPSSIHEIIAVPLEDIDVRETKEMVMQINENEVETEEQLGNNVYRYVAKTGDIVFADAKEDRRICFRKPYAALGEQFEVGEVVDVFTYCGTQNYVKRNGKVIRIPKNVCCRGCKR